LPESAPTVIGNAEDPPGNVGCMLFLGFLLIVFPPLLFLAAPVALMFILAGFLAWFMQMALQRFCGKVPPFTLFLILWGILSVVFIAGLSYLKYRADYADIQFIQ
jgi:hypothetical protein